jgi:hypothetical protein
MHLEGQPNLYANVLLTANHSDEADAEGGDDVAGNLPGLLLLVLGGLLGFLLLNTPRAVEA